MSKCKGWLEGGVSSLDFWKPPKIPGNRIGLVHRRVNSSRLPDLPRGVLSDALDVTVLSMSDEIYVHT
jgi:hypothetical protein